MSQVDTRGFSSVMSDNEAQSDAESEFDESDCGLWDSESESDNDNEEERRSDSSQDDAADQELNDIWSAVRNKPTHSAIAVPTSGNSFCLSRQVISGSSASDGSTNPESVTIAPLDPQHPSLSAYRQTTRANRPIALKDTNVHRWEVSAVPDSSSYVTVTDRLSNNVLLKQVMIPINRLDKFKQKADLESIKTKVIGNVRACVANCSKQCYNKFGLDDILTCRLSCFQTQTTEQQVTEHLVSRLRSNNPTVQFDSRKLIAYTVNNRPTCSVFWASAYGVCEDKMKSVRTMLRGGSSIMVHGNKGKLVGGGLDHNSQYDMCYAFWHHFFEENCQRPNDTLRLFPVNNSMRFIYDAYFVSWIGKQIDKDRQESIDHDDPDIDSSYRIPSFAYLKKVRWDPDFRDVTRRAKHYHCLCKTCDSLKTRRLKGFANSYHETTWKTMFDAHEAEKHGWRKLEKARETQVRATPRDAILLQYDDTSALGLPKLSNRNVKNITKSRFQVTPFNICNYASGTQSAFL